MKKLMFVMVLSLFWGSSVMVLADELVTEDPVVDPIVVIDPIDPELIVCVLPEVLNEDGDACVDPTSVVETTHRKTGSYLPGVFERLQEELSLQNKVVYVWDVVKLGDKGQDVKDFQSYLNFKGANLKVDGKYGPLTLAAWNSIK